MSVFDIDAFDNHEAVHFFADEASGLQCIIALHSTALGPGAGGTRFWTYPDSQAALTDVLRLSQGMSYKNAMAGLALGGGKAVILKPEGAFDRHALFAAYGRAIESLHGRYITAEDVGVSVEDMGIVRTQTKFVGGLCEGAAASGDPSPKTALGVFEGLKAAVRHRLGREDLSGLKVAVQGIGHVGFHLCRLLHEAGAVLYVSDINEAACVEAETKFGARQVALDAIYDLDVDVYAPCALGATVNTETLPRLKAKVIAGAANNQLADDAMGPRLRQRGILYAPDYVINAGGIINVAAEVNGRYEEAVVLNKVRAIAKTLGEIFARADAEDRPTAVIADEMAKARIAHARTEREAV